MTESSASMSRLEGPPVFITGTPKSGKSVLLEVFRQLKSFHVRDEPLSTWNIGTHSNQDDCRTAADAAPEERNSIRNSIVRECHALGASRYADDLSHHALQIPYLKSVFPDARIVVVTRDPRSFLPEALYFWTLKPSLLRTLRIRWRQLKPSSFYSMARRFLKNMESNRTQGRLNTWGAIVPGQSDFARTHSVVELAAYQWATLHAVAIEHAHTNQSIFFVKFEDLLHTPRETIKEVFRFCQAPATPEIIEFAANHFNPKFDFTQKKELTEAQWNSVWPVVHKVAKRLGYAVPG